MDFLKAEIASASKRKADADAVSPTDGPSEQAKKYLRRGELERIREEEYRKEQEQKLLARKRKEEEKRAKREKRSKVCIAAACPMSSARLAAIAY